MNEVKLSATVTINVPARSSTFIDFLYTRLVDMDRWEHGVTEYECGMCTIVIDNNIDTRKEFFNKITMSSKNGLYDPLVYKLINDIASIWKPTIADLFRFNEPTPWSSIQYHHVGDSYLEQLKYKVGTFIGYHVVRRWVAFKEHIEYTVFKVGAMIRYNKYMFLKIGTYYSKRDDKLKGIDISLYMDSFDWSNTDDNTTMRYYMGRNDDGDLMFSFCHYGYDELVLNKEGDKVVEIKHHYDMGMGL